MKKVWLANTGEYSDYSIRGVFSSPEKCAEFMDKFPRDEWNDPEEWDIDPLKSCHRGKHPFFLRISEDGVVSEIDAEHSCYGFSGGMYNDPSFDIRGNLILFIWARDEKHAIKIANEKRIQVLALHQWRKREG